MMRFRVPTVAPIRTACVLGSSPSRSFKEVTRTSKKPLGCIPRTATGLPKPGLGSAPFAFFCSRCLLCCPRGFLHESESWRFLPYPSRLKRAPLSVRTWISRLTSVVMFFSPSEPCRCHPGRHAGRGRGYGWRVRYSLRRFRQVRGRCRSGRPHRSRLLP